MFSCGQIYINIEIFSLIQQNIQSDKTDELSHQILNITSFGNTKGKKKNTVTNYFRHAG